MIFQVSDIITLRFLLMHLLLNYWYMKHFWKDLKMLMKSKMSKVYWKRFSKTRKNFLIHSRFSKERMPYIMSI